MLALVKDFISPGIKYTVNVKDNDSQSKYDTNITVHNVEQNKQTPGKLQAVLHVGFSEGFHLP